jgi:hypothetical protein
VSADPTSPAARPLGALVERLSAEGRLRGTRAGGRPVPTGDVASIAVTGVTHDSRAVRPGMLFVAVPGLRVDGHDYVPAAIEAGAAGVIVERPDPRGRRAAGRRGCGSSCTRVSRRVVVRRPVAGADRHRHHRHRRQDDDRLPRGLGARGGWSSDRDDRHDRDQDRRPDG